MVSVNSNSRRLRASRADQNLHESNSTAHIFLGDTRRKWMPSPSSPETALPTQSVPARPERQRGMRDQDLSSSISPHLSAKLPASPQDDRGRPAVVPPVTAEAALRSPITPLIASKNPFLRTQQPPAGSASHATDLDPSPAAALPSPVPSVSSHASHLSAVVAGGDGLDADTTPIPPSPSAGLSAMAQPPSKELGLSRPPAQPMTQEAVTSNASNGPVEFPQSPPSLPLNEAAWIQWQRSLEALKLEVQQRTQASPCPGLTGERVNILLNALLERDSFFIVFHQLYCLRTSNPGLYAQIAELQQPECSQAMVLLQGLGMDNRHLPPGLLSRFAVFPDSPLKLRQEGWYTLKLREISSSLMLLATGRSSLLVEVYSRQCPPLVDELRQRFAVTSLAFISIIFVDVCRHLYDQRYLPRLNQLFFKDRAIVLQQSSSSGWRNVAAEQSSRMQLIQEYRKIPLKPINSPQTTHPSPAAPAATPIHTTPQMISSANVQSPRVGPSAFGRNQSASASPAAFVNSTDPSALTSSRGVPCLPGNPSPHFPQAANSPAPPSMASGPRHSLEGQGARPVGHPFIQSSAPPPPGQTAVQGPHNQLVGQQPMLSQLSTPAPAPVPLGKASQSPPNTPLLPSPNYRPPINAHPNPLRLALHQSDLREPVKKLIHRGPNGEQVDTELFQYMSGFFLAPTFLDPEQSSHEWAFLLSSADWLRLPRTVDQGIGQRPLQIFQAGCRTLRLRSIGLPISKQEEAHRIWATAATVWPSVFYVFVNDEELFVRRKLHNGRDLPLDITNYLREGENRITIHMLLDSDECKDLQCVFGIEVLEVAEFSQLKSMVRVISAADSRATIQKRLSPGTNDDEVAVVTDNLTVSLLDPFSALIFNIPARSRWCGHQECFDLDNFLMTRKSVSGTAPMKDNWQCPICKADARPQCLVADSFLAVIRKELARTKRLDGAQAVQIAFDGSWSLKVINDASDNTAKKGHSPNLTTLKRKADASVHRDSLPDRQTPHRKIDGSGPTLEPVVIELD